MEPFNFNLYLTELLEIYLFDYLALCKQIAVL